MGVKTCVPDAASKYKFPEPALWLDRPFKVALPVVICKLPLLKVNPPPVADMEATFVDWVPRSNVPRVI